MQTINLRRQLLARSRRCKRYALRNFNQLMITNKKLIATAILAAVVGFSACYALEQRFEAARSVSTASAVAATTGGLINLYFDSTRSADIDTSRRVLRAIRDQAVTLISLNLDPAEMDALGFAGICQLVSSSSRLFYLTKSDSVEGMMDPFLRAQLGMLREAIAKESLKRSQRIGDTHACPGFN